MRDLKYILEYFYLLLFGGHILHEILKNFRNLIDCDGCHSCENKLVNKEKAPLIYLIATRVVRDLSRALVSLDLFWWFLFREHPFIMHCPFHHASIAFHLHLRPYSLSYFITVLVRSVGGWGSSRCRAHVLRYYLNYVRHSSRILKVVYNSQFLACLDVQIPKHQNWCAMHGWPTLVRSTASHRNRLRNRLRNHLHNRHTNRHRNHSNRKKYVHQMSSTRRRCSLPPTLLLLPHHHHHHHLLLLLLLLLLPFVHPRESRLLPTPCALLLGSRLPPTPRALLLLHLLLSLEVSFMQCYKQSDICITDYFEYL